MHPNELSSIVMTPHREMGSGGTALSIPMMERVKKRVFDEFMDASTTPQTKTVAAKAHAELAHKDVTFGILSRMLPGHPVLAGDYNACNDLQQVID